MTEKDKFSQEGMPSKEDKVRWGMMKRLLFVVLITFFWIVAVAGVNLIVFSRIPSSHQEPKSFHFERGTPFSSILDELHDEFKEYETK